MAEDDTNGNSFVSERAREAYIAALYLLDVFFNFARFSQATHVNTLSEKVLQKAVFAAQQTADAVLRFIPFRSTSLRLAVFSDASLVSKQISVQDSF